MDKFTPTVLNKFKIYNENDVLKYYGEEIKLPNIEQIAATIKGAGTGGELEVPVVGMTSNLQVELNFITYGKESSSLFALNKQASIIVRGAMQVLDHATGVQSFKSVKATMKGWAKSYEPGTLKPGEQTNAKVTMNLTYYKLETDGRIEVEVDKLNDVFVVDGEDILREVRDLC